MARAAAKQGSCQGSGERSNDWLQFADYRPLFFYLSVFNLPAGKVCVRGAASECQMKPIQHAAVISSVFLWLATTLS